MPKSPERCEEIRKETKNRILRESLLYFARNGFAGTKINDLAKHMGIGKGTMYLYFESKEALFAELVKMVGSQDTKPLLILSKLPINARKKIMMLSEEVLQDLDNKPGYAELIAFNVQLMFEDTENIDSSDTYQSEVYQILAKIIEQGQKEGSVVEGNSMKLADYYWGVVYLYALKKLFTTKYEMIDATDLARTILK